MKPFVQITFSTGHVFEIATAAIAEDRTRYYVFADPNRTREQHEAETQMFFADDFEVFDWMKNNMNWSDVQKTARLIAFRPPDFSEGWGDAVLESRSEQATPDLAALGENAMLAPFELAMTQAQAEGNPCLVMAFLHPGSSQIGSAAVVLVGGPEIVGGYIAQIKHFDDYMRQQLDAAKSTTDKPN